MVTASLQRAAFQENQRPGLAVWLATLLPVLPIVLAMSVEPLVREAEVVTLDGEWRFRDGADDARDPALDDSAWHTFHVPGKWLDGERTKHGWMRRRFDLPDQLADADLFLMVPSLRNAFARVYLNGRLLGEKGVPAAARAVDVSRLDGYSVPKDALRRTDNVLAVDVMPPNPSQGLADRRFFLGPPEIVKTYLDRATTVKAFLEYGALLLSLSGAVLVAYLLSRGSGQTDRALYRSSLLIMCVIAVYLMGKTGVFVGFFLNSAKVDDWIAYCIIGIALATPELVESYYLHRVTWFRKINRAVCALVLLATLPIGVSVVYPVFNRWLFLVIVHALVFAIRDLVRPRTALGPLLASAIAVTAATGAADLLSDLDVVYFPRLFSYGCANLGVIAIVLVLIDFLRLSRRTYSLSLSLTEKNAALGIALERAEEMARVKSEFLANTSHELRTPLNAIINIPQGLLEEIEERNVVRCRACEALFEPLGGEEIGSNAACPTCNKRGSLTLEVRRFAPEDGDALAAHLRSVIGAGRHLLAVVNDILDFSKLEAGRMRLTLEDVGVADVVRRAVETISPVAEAAGVKLEAAPIPESVRVVGDGTRVVQVLINLAGNAIKFSARGGSVDLDARSDGDDVVIRVRDKGIGIAPENHALIFESFRQIEGGHTRKHGGTGLGLAIVKKLVEMHGGSVAVESATGKGSTFTVRLPQRGPDPSTLTPLAPTSTSERPRVTTQV